MLAERRRRPDQRLGPLDLAVPRETTAAAIPGTQATPGDLKPLRRNRRQIAIVVSSRAGVAASRRPPGQGSATWLTTPGGGLGCYRLPEDRWRLRNCAAIHGKEKVHGSIP